jgi:hypothetical protein
MKKPSIPLLKRKVQEPEHYLQVSKATIDLHASTILPKHEKLRFIHPKALEIPNIGFKREKVILEMMSSAVRKAPLPVFTIVLILMFGAVAMAIIYDQVIEPWMDKSIEVQEKIQRGELPPDAKPPSLFNFQVPNLPIPGVK